MSPASDEFHDETLRQVQRRPVGLFLALMFAACMPLLHEWTVKIWGGGL